MSLILKESFLQQLFIHNINNPIHYLLKSDTYIQQFRKYINYEH